MGISRNVVPSPGLPPNFILSCTIPGSGFTGYGSMLLASDSPFFLVGCLCNKLSFGLTRGRLLCNFEPAAHSLIPFIWTSYGRCLLKSQTQYGCGYEHAPGMGFVCRKDMTLSEQLMYSPPTARRSTFLSGVGGTLRPTAPYLYVAYSELLFCFRAPITLMPDIVTQRSQR